jgi:hypothetical protein
MAVVVIGIQSDQRGSQEGLVDHLRTGKME